MTDKEVAVMVENGPLSSYYESVVAGLASDQKRIRLATNYILNTADSMALITIAPANFVELISMVESGQVSSKVAKDLIEMLLKDPKASPKALAQAHGLIQTSDSGAIQPIIDKVLSDNAKAVAEYKAGKAASLQFLIGQAMKLAKGSNPGAVKELLLQKLS
jgi:aspartyl-tRNA(Asn)/glutamyl-tRNA(Gln) amidotransferase subunit B